MVIYYGHRAQVSYGEESSPGTKATTSAAQFGLLSNFDTPDEKITWHKYHNIGDGRDYGLKAEGKHVVEGTLNVVLQRADPLFYAFGQTTETGTGDGTGGSTLNGATAAGATSIILADATGYSNGEYIQVDVTSKAEVREILSIASAPTLTLTKGLRLAHSSGVACAEVIGPYTHTTVLADTLTPITIEVAMLEDTDVVRFFDGCYFDTLELSCEEDGQLQASFGIKGMKTESTGTSATEISTSSTAPYMYDEGVMTCFGGTIGTVKSFKITMNNKLTPQWYLQATAPLYASAVHVGNRECQIQMTMVPATKAYIDLLKTPSTATSFSAKFSRGANDYIDIQATNVHLAEGAHNIPEEGAVSVDMTLECQTIVIESKDSTPYYLAV